MTNKRHVGRSEASQSTLQSKINKTKIIIKKMRTVMLVPVDPATDAPINVGWNIVAPRTTICPAALNGGVGVILAGLRRKKKKKRGVRVSTK